MPSRSATTRRVNPAGKKRSALLGNGLPQAGIGRPVLGLLAGDGDHAGDQDDRAGLELGGDQRRGEASERLGDHDQVTAAQPAGRAGHRIGVLRQSGRVVLARQVRRGGLVSRARSSRSTKCQYQPTSAAPWISANAAT
jgi:hypothetical protein